jgi:hypothetical protein
MSEQYLTKTVTNDRLNSSTTTLMFTLTRQYILTLSSGILRDTCQKTQKAKRSERSFLAGVQENIVVVSFSVLL